MMNKFILLQTAYQEVARNSANEFLQYDPYGFSMTIIAMSVVFSALVLLYLVFRYLAKAFIKREQRLNLKKKGVNIAEMGNISDLSGEVVAAISTAIHLYRSQLHDMESFRLTIQRVSKTYSPWSSKIYGLRKVPERIIPSRIQLKAKK